MIEGILRSIGLSNYEARVYLALIELGEATTGQIQKQAGLNSGRIYEILNGLNKKGFITELKKNKTKIFKPVNPRQAYKLLEEKEKSLEKQKESFRKILPSLLSKINNKKEEVNIEIFTGMNGLKTAYAKEIEFSNKNSKLYILSVLSEEAYSKELYDFFIYNQQPLREKHNLKIKKILAEKARKKRKEQHERSAEIKYLPYTSPVAINIIEDLSIIGIELDNPVIITIENKETADSFRKHFDILWKIAKS
jgi:sugar-specific transcriptional regulator TrmB